MYFLHSVVIFLISIHTNAIDMYINNGFILFTFIVVVYYYNTLSLLQLAVLLMTLPEAPPPTILFGGTSFLINV